MTELSRRTFLSGLAAAGFGGLVASMNRALGLENLASPLEHYPDRGWEKVYRDLYKADSEFAFLCAPNDTHNCLLKAYVKNGAIARIGPSFGYGKATDIYGNVATHRWDPRVCQKGLALTRRFYGDRRVRYPMIRKGWKDWADAGFPRDPKTGVAPPEYFRRGADTWVRATWDEASSYAAKALVAIATAYDGEEGAKRLAAQSYDPDMIEAMHGAGVQALKFRGGMPLLGTTRIYALNRFANQLALLDAHVRKVGADRAVGARGWDSYSWHTDLPPGHPMVTGQQTVEFDLHAVEHADIVLVWGMNWIATKMPDAHWLTEARLTGTRVVVIACEYSATANKGDDVLVVRPGTTPALALGLCHVIFKEKLYDLEAVRRFSDMPLLLRTDTWELLRAGDVFPGYSQKPLSNRTRVLGPGDKPGAPGVQGDQEIPAELRDAWGDYVMWQGGPVALSRDEVGEKFQGTPELEGTFQVPLAKGGTVACRPIFDVMKELCLTSHTPEITEEITWAPKEAVVSLARAIAAAPQKTLMATGMGPNQFFNNDLKDRAIFLLAALTDNVGHVGGNVGSYAGNYRTALFNGLGQFIYEDPFQVVDDPKKPAKVTKYWKAESAHYYNYGDRPLRVGKRNWTGKSHMPTPTKVMWVANGNSILGNAKWHYDVVQNTLPRMEMICSADWWWTATSEYSDIVFAADSWAEFKHPDMTASVTNPFLTLYPVTPLKRIYDTRSDIEVPALVAAKLAEITGDGRWNDLWKFVHEGRTDVYMQRILDAGSNTRGYDVADLHAKAKEGIPAYHMSRTTPRWVGYEQRYESAPWYTKTGRLEFYREEPEFRSSGENLPVYREPIDSTFYEPNVIVSSPLAALSPETPEQCGFSPDDLDCETRQVRHVVKPWSEVRNTKHPAMKDGRAFVFHTPKYRHGAHTTPVDTDMNAVLFGPFGDIYRHDRRKPFVTEGYVDINPDDAKELGVDDGDYVWVDADGKDRPYRGAKEGDEFMKTARLLCRARYYPGTPRGVTRMWYNMYGATIGSTRGAATRPDGLAKNPETNYQAMFRSGSHQSGTRAWLKPTLMTETLVRKDGFGQSIGKGFFPDVHCPVGAPREAFVKITRAEPGGTTADSPLWRPASMGLRTRYESEVFKSYLDGDFLKERG
ncbi:MAG: hypothetical protein AMXMBFR64_15820 [Myxococcales bacterium]